ncbi:MAG: hypothetical protein V1862_05950, partial [Methanobacteriota archaeon]
THYEVSMMDGSLVLALISTGAATINGNGLVMIWIMYKNQAHESLIFASEVLGALQSGEEEEGYPPPDLGSRSTRDHQSGIFKSLTGFRNREIFYDATRMCRDTQSSGAWRTGPIPVLHNYWPGRASDSP